MPMTRDNASASNQNSVMSIEQRLELLEPRFTTPSNPILGSPPGLPDPAPFAGRTVDRGAAIGVGADYHHQDSSPSSKHSSNHSHHSFTFATPMSRDTNTNSDDGIMSSASNLPSSSVRSKRRPSLSSSFHAVSMAASKHIRKVAALSTVQQHSGGSNSSSSVNNSMPASLLVMNDANRSMSGLPSSSNSRASSHSASNQTLLTSHVQGSNRSTFQRQFHQQQNHPQQHRVVVESPPVSVTPQADPQTTTVTTSTSPAPGNAKPSAARDLQIASSGDAAPASNTTGQKRKSTPKRKSSSVKDKSVISSPSGNSISESKKRQRRQSIPSNPAEKNSGQSPRQNNQTSIAAFATSEHSRDRSNPPISKASKLKPPTNNKSLLDFFNPGTQKKKAAETSVSTTALHDKVGTTTTTTKGAVTGASDVGNAWYEKCQALQQQLQDKDEQIRAITDNRTIYQTALQSALNKTKVELEGARRSLEEHTKKTGKVMEELLRWKSSQQAKELREKLAADGARLGRIVVSRAGMRAVESWEEGYATKDLEHRKAELKSKKAKLESRLRSFQSSTGGGVSNKENRQDDDEQDDKRRSNDPSLSALELVEAKESITMHLDNIRRREQELAEEEQALNDEKGSHIRALKRVSSEDNSRFRTRPKLHDRYVLHCLLGKGGFSEVWRGYDLVELREVAVKIHQLDPRWPDSKKENYTKHVSREYEIHRNVRHSRIVSLYDVFEIDNNSFATVLECCKGTDLDTILKARKRLPEKEARAILLQILAGMQYLSQPSADGTRQGIIHYDLKPGNILFDEFGDAKITDFGLSKIVDTPDPAESMELTSQGAGTYWYLPPECFVTNERVRISNKVDVWSIGVIYYQMLYGRRPFGEGKSQDKLLADHTMLNAQQVHFPDQSDVSDSAQAFLRQCLMYDQAFRPTIAQLCENPYILQRQY